MANFSRLVGFKMGTEDYLVPRGLFGHETYIGHAFCTIEQQCWTIELHDSQNDVFEMNSVVYDFVCRSEMSSSKNTFMFS